jgi:starch synthase (maltosyl-transferring)
MPSPTGRIPVLDVSPQVEGGAYATKAILGEPVPLGATVFRDGHALVGATAVLTRPDGTQLRVDLQPRSPGEGPRRTDWWVGEVVVDQLGEWSLLVEGWADTWATWRRDLQAKLDAGQDSFELSNDLENGALLLQRQGLHQEAKQLRDAGLLIGDRVAPSLALADIGLRELVSPSQSVPLVVERERAARGFWYELFPRSHGGFKGTAEHLPYVASLGADVVYLPPVHPIGSTHRKGRDNTLTPGPHDVGSPWAIGAAQGGHDALHPDLGDEEDFRHLVRTAAELGMEIALDLALQASPDHPWVHEHPEFFTRRPDGSIAYAENPPKKYQDIHPIDFDSGGQALWEEVLRVVRHWIALGVRAFRVDNPHTKPVAFWQWLIAQVRTTHPDVIWLSEAFTRPPMLHLLAMAGFSQSYTYITWRTGRGEVEDYLRELSTPPGSLYLRPALWPNTPDILHDSLVHGGLPMFRSRAVLCAAGSPVWGVYEGFELGENTPVRPGSEEYDHSEKYELRTRDLRDPPLRGLITELNDARRGHPALQHLTGLHVHDSRHPDLTVFSRQHGEDTVIAVVSLDPSWTREATICLDLEAMGLGPHFAVEDLIGTRGSYEWHAEPFVQLTPEHPAHLMAVRR